MLVGGLSNHKGFALAFQSHRDESLATAEIKESVRLARYIRLTFGWTIQTPMGKNQRRKNVPAKSENDFGLPVSANAKHLETK